MPCLFAGSAEGDVVDEGGLGDGDGFGGRGEVSELADLRMRAHALPEVDEDVGVEGEYGSISAVGEASS